METINTRSFARAGLLGNPSDGYFGKTLSFAFANFGVDLRLTESARMRFVPGEVDDATFDSPEKLVHDLRLFGYYGGIRMLKAVSKRFFEYCFEHGISIPRRNFTAEYKINIPRLVGLSGSSAICSAMLKALCRFYEVPILDHSDILAFTDSNTLPSSNSNISQFKHSNISRSIPLAYAPTICLEAEKYELGINCGFQDRVIQMYNGLVFMDFEQSYVEAHNHGRYEPLDPTLIGGTLSPLVPSSSLPSSSSPLHLYVAFDPNRAEESGKAHKKVKGLFEAGKQEILAAMSEFADIAQRGRDALVGGRLQDIPALVNANFDLRDRIFNVAEQNRQMVMVARSAGASAKFAGSGGAIVGTYEDEAQFSLLRSRLATIGCTTLKPIIATSDDVDVAGMGDGVWRNS